MRLRWLSAIGAAMVMAVSPMAPSVAVTVSEGAGLWPTGYTPNV